MAAPVLVTGSSAVEWRKEEGAVDGVRRTVLPIHVDGFSVGPGNAIHSAAAWGAINSIIDVWLRDQRCASGFDPYDVLLDDAVPPWKMFVMDDALRQRFQGPSRIAPAPVPAKYEKNDKAGADDDSALIAEVRALFASIKGSSKRIWDTVPKRLHVTRSRRAHLEGESRKPVFARRRETGLRNREPTGDFVQALSFQQYQDAFERCMRDKAGATTADLMVFYEMFQRCQWICVNRRKLAAASNQKTVDLLCAHLTLLAARVLRIVCRIRERAERPSERDRSACLVTRVDFDEIERECNAAGKHAAAAFMFLQDSYVERVPGSNDSNAKTAAEPVCIETEELAARKALALCLRRPVLMAWFSKAVPRAMPRRVAVDPATSNSPKLGESGMFIDNTQILSMGKDGVERHPLVLAFMRQMTDRVAYITPARCTHFAFQWSKTDNSLLNVLSVVPSIALDGQRPRSLIDFADRWAQRVIGSLQVDFQGLSGKSRAIGYLERLFGPLAAAKYAIDYNPLLARAEDLLKHPVRLTLNVDEGVYTADRAPVTVIRRNGRGLDFDVKGVAHPIDALWATVLALYQVWDGAKDRSVQSILRCVMDAYTYIVLRTILRRVWNLTVAPVEEVLRQFDLFLDDVARPLPAYIYMKDEMLRMDNLRREVRMLDNRFDRIMSKRSLLAAAPHFSDIDAFIAKLFTWTRVAKPSDRATLLQLFVTLRKDVKALRLGQPKEAKEKQSDVKGSPSSSSAAPPANTPTGGEYKSAAQIWAESFMKTSSENLQRVISMYDGDGQRERPPNMIQRFEGMGEEWPPGMANAGPQRVMSVAEAKGTRPGAVPISTINVDTPAFEEDAHMARCRALLKLVSRKDAIVVDIAAGVKSERFQNFRTRWLAHRREVKSEPRDFFVAPNNVWPAQHTADLAAKELDEVDRKNPRQVAVCLIMMNHTLEMGNGPGGIFSLIPFPPAIQGSPSLDNHGVVFTMWVPRSLIKQLYLIMAHYKDQYPGLTVLTAPHNRGFALYIARRPRGTLITPGEVDLALDALEGYSHMTRRLAEAVGHESLRQFAEYKVANNLEIAAHEYNPPKTGRVDFLAYRQYAAGENRLAKSSPIQKDSLESGASAAAAAAAASAAPKGLSAPSGAHLVGRGVRCEESNKGLGEWFGR